MGILRLLLALSVVAAHCGAIFGCRFVGAQTAVQSFFIISGFYMSLVLNEKYMGANNSYKLFISNRFFRIYPIYWTVLLLTVLACLSVMLATGGQSAPKFINYLQVKPNLFSFGYLVLSNIFIFGQDLVMFAGIHPGNGHLYFTGRFMESQPALFLFLFVPQSWTLALEGMFYLLAPFIVKRKPAIVLVVITASLALRIFMFRSAGLDHDPWTFRFFPTELLFFLLGYFSYQAYVKIKNIHIPPALNGSILAGMIVFTLAFQYFPDSTATCLSFTAKEGIYFLCVAVFNPFLFNFLKNNRLDNQLGELSYPVYMSHFLVSMVCHSLPGMHLIPGWGVALASIVFSIFLNIAIGKPVDKYRQSRLKNKWQAI